MASTATPKGKLRLSATVVMRGVRVKLPALTNTHELKLASRASDGQFDMVRLAERCVVIVRTTVRTALLAR